MNQKLTMSINHEVFTRLRYMQTFTIEMILHQISMRLVKQNAAWNSFFDRRTKRIDDTVAYALNENRESGSEIPNDEIVLRTVRSLDGELGVAYILGGIPGIFAWLDNDDITFDVPTPDFNIEVKTSFSRWPTMHTAGAAPYGRANDGLCLYAGYKGNADVFIVLHMEHVDDQLYYHPNYFFTKRAMEAFPSVIATRRAAGGVYVNRNQSKFTYFYKNWCTR